MRAFARVRGRMNKRDKRGRLGNYIYIYIYEIVCWYSHEKWENGGIVTIRFLEIRSIL